MSDETKVTPKEAEPQKQTAAEMDAEIKAAELALKRINLKNAELEMELKHAQLQDAREQLDSRKVKREDKESKIRANGQNLKQDRMRKNANQGVCNHRKGGDGAAGVVGGKGTDAQYAVMKHVFANGDTWVRCLRCGKTWKPPLKKRFKSDEAYKDAIAVYMEAVNFPTRNHTSSSQQFEWGYSEDRSQGGKEFYREVMEAVNLE